MSLSEELRGRSRMTWAAGDWDSFAVLIAPVGVVVLERAQIAPRVSLLDVGTGNGTNIAIPAAERGAQVTGVDLTPELLERARRHAAERGVEIEWIEADAQELPLADGSFDRVVSTFGAMFASDHRLAAAELVRVCRAGGRIVMTTWVNDGFAGELFKLSGSFGPPPPPGIGVPPQWGVEEHIHEMFGAAGATVGVDRETVYFDFPSIPAMVERYAADFGPFAAARGLLEPQGRWNEFLEAFALQVRSFNTAGDGTVRIPSDYYVILAEL